MAKKPGTNPKNEYVFFNVVYEDGSQRSNRRVPAELLERIPPLHLLAIGAEVERLLRPTEAERGNSDSPSPSPSAAASSMAANPPTAIIH